jgi:hypothetical protein
VGEGRVVQRPGRLGDADRLGAHLNDERLADAPRGLVGVGRGDAEAAGGDSLEVLGAAGERHDRVQGERQGAVLDGRPQDLDAVRAAGVHDDLAGPQRFGGGEPADHPGEGVVGQREQDQVGPGDDLVRRQERDVREEVLGAPHRLLRDAGGGHDRVAGPRQGGPEHRADPAGGDHADGKARRSVHPASPELSERA